MEVSPVLNLTSFHPFKLGQELIGDEFVVFASEMEYLALFWRVLVSIIVFFNEPKVDNFHDDFLVILRSGGFRCCWNWCIAVFCKDLLVISFLNCRNLFNFVHCSSPLLALWEIGPTVTLPHDVITLVINLKISDGWLVSTKIFTVCFCKLFLQHLISLVDFIISSVYLLLKIIVHLATVLHLCKKGSITLHNHWSVSCSTEVQHRVDRVPLKFIFGVVTRIKQCTKNLRQKFQ